MDQHDHSNHPHDPGASPSRDAVRSRAWRSRHGAYLQSLLRASGVAAPEGSTRSHMAHLKRVFASIWAEALREAPASMIRHDPALSRAERRRISSVKNNRLCRHRHHVFLEGVERDLERRGALPAEVAEERRRQQDARAPQAQVTTPHAHQGHVAAPRLGAGHLAPPAAPHAVPPRPVAARPVPRPLGSRADDY